MQILGPSKNESITILGSPVDLVFLTEIVTECYIQLNGPWGKDPIGTMFGLLDYREDTQYLAQHRQKIKNKISEIIQTFPLPDKKQRISLNKKQYSWIKKNLIFLHNFPFDFSQGTVHVEFKQSM